MKPALLEVSQLSISFQVEGGRIYAVNDLSYSLQAGETLGIVGESGSGKSVSSAALMGLLPSPPARIAPESRLSFDGIDLLALDEKAWRKIRGKRISMIFQDPMTSLNPYMTIGDQVAEPLVLHEGLSWKEARARAVEELHLMGIPDAEARAASYPHEFSGGMRQRVMIAMALITRPEILIADEPTTALDVTVQKQVLDLLHARQKELGTAIILITHDLGLVEHYADRTLVMYAGSIIEQAATADLLQQPRHAYTRALLASIPHAGSKGKPLPSIPGIAPSLRHAPDSCAFRERNELGDPALCAQGYVPELRSVGEQHLVRDCPGCLATGEDSM